MLEIAGGIILVFFPYLLVIALYLIPPALGVVIGGFIGTMVAEGDGMLAGALFGLVGGIWVDLALTRE
jgi:hypothetical protein